MESGRHPQVGVFRQGAVPIRREVPLPYGFLDDEEKIFGGQCGESAAVFHGIEAQQDLGVRGQSPIANGRCQSLHYLFFVLDGCGCCRRVGNEWARRIQADLLAEFLALQDLPHIQETLQVEWGAHGHGLLFEIRISAQ